MSENLRDIEPSIYATEGNESQEPEGSSLAPTWGFEMETIIGGSTDVTVGWKGEAVLGLETSVKANAILSLGAIVMVPPCLALMAIPSADLREAAYKKLLATADFLKVTRKEPDLTKRGAGTGSLPAAFDITLGAECTAIIGNDYSFTTGFKQDLMNGEITKNFADSIEFLEANSYEFISGQEFTVEAGNQGTNPQNQELITRYCQRTGVYEDSAEHKISAGEYTLAGQLVEISAKKSQDHALNKPDVGDIKVTAERNLKLGAEGADGAISITAKKNIEVGAPELELKATTTGKIEAKTLELSGDTFTITSTKTSIKGTLELGDPGVVVPVDISAQLQALQESMEAAQEDIDQGKKAIQKGMATVRSLAKNTRKRA